MEIKGVRVLKADSPMTIVKGMEKQRKVSVAEQRRIDKCLNCKKPVEECKGDCGGVWG